MSDAREAGEHRAQLEAVERGLQGALGRLDRALALCEQLQAGQQTLLARLTRVEAQLEALDASFVRHQGQNEEDLRRAGEAVERVQQGIDQHEDAHLDGRWRSR